MSDDTIVIHLSVHDQDRSKIRNVLLEQWSKENPGMSGKYSRYRYNVDSLADGSWIYLVRPARLNKGCDFTIICENFLYFKNGNPKPPKHEDLYNELTDLVGASNEHELEFLDALRHVWECEEVDYIVSRLKLFGANVRAERALKLAKWMFIEQDVTDWNYSGRAMLRKAIEEKFGSFPNHFSTD